MGRAAYARTVRPYQIGSFTGFVCVFLDGGDERVGEGVGRAVVGDGAVVHQDGAGTQTTHEGHVVR